MSLLEQVGALREGRVTSAELVEASLERAAEREDLHAFVRLRGEAARADAAAADRARADGDTRPLLGVPLAVKDSHAVAGMPLPAAGTAATERPPAAASDPWVGALVAAGCVVVGQTTMPALAMTPWGPARNPFDIRRAAGGSSSGSAAAVAAGIVELATASDGGGSIRIPAAMCGLFGFKPAQGLLPGAGGWHGLSTSGVLTATAADTALVLDETIGAGVGAGWAATEAAEAGTLRIGWTDTPPSPLGKPSADAVRAVATSVATLQAAGHAVSEATPKLADAGLSLTPRILSGMAGDYAELRAAAGAFALPQPQRWTSALGGRLPAGLVQRAVHHGETVRKRMVTMPYDVLLMPTLPDVAPVQDDAKLQTPVHGLLQALKYAAWTGPWNVTALPAASVPVTRDPAGLPVGVQLVDLRGPGKLLFPLARLLAA